MKSLRTMQEWNYFLRKANPVRLLANRRSLQIAPLISSRNEKRAPR
jgi:hypothetical protein